MELTGEIQLDVVRVKKQRSFGAGKLFTKVVELVEEKVNAEIPVLIFLQSIREYRSVQGKLEDAFIFDLMDEAKHTENLGVLDKFMNNPLTAPKVILTTHAASYGFNFHPTCYVIMTF